MLTSILIFLPIAGALFVWIVPWPTPRAAGGAALLVALAELIVWVNRALNFDYGNPGLQDEASHSWFSDSASRTRSASSTSRSGSWA